jgi:hypothetical protein
MVNFRGIAYGDDDDRIFVRLDALERRAHNLLEGKPSEVEFGAN